MADKKETAKIGEGKRGPGRPKGVPNKINADLKAMIHGALADAGGRNYLAQQARENPGPFLTLLGKTLPKEITGSEGEPLIPHRVEVVAVKP